MTLPNFLIIGAPKCGTTSMASYLGQHPEVFVSPWKEPNYFALVDRSLPEKGPADPEIVFALLYRFCTTNFEDYQALFDGVSDERAIGEASVRYLYYPEAAKRIHETLPDVRMIAILREPVSRLYSHYCMMVQFQLEPLGLLEAIEAEKTRIADDWGWDWHYQAVGRYAEQLERYFNLFGRDRLKVILYDDYSARPLEVYQDVCRYLGIDDAFAPNMSGRGKVAYRPKNLTIDRWLHWPNPLRDRIRGVLPTRIYRSGMSALAKLNGAKVPKLDRETRRDLAERFREDNDRLENLLSRKLPWNERID